MPNPEFESPDVRKLDLTVDEEFHLELPTEDSALAECLNKVTDGTRKEIGSLESRDDGMFFEDDEMGFKRREYEAMALGIKVIPSADCLFIEGTRAEDFKMDEDVSAFYEQVSEHISQSYAEKLAENRNNEPKQ